jgi:glycosyltransferase involved in cell wall biosynthesis
MKEQLIYLGADAHKVFYQPDFVDLSLYQHVDVSNNPPVCLAIGRFAETKSPHLTILAFHKVLAQIPEARLVMVGKDGGGELFEACHILVRALRIAHAVDFKGILPPAQIYDLMKTSRVFVQHSLTTPLHEDKEGTPVAVMEASAAGLPVVATTHAGIKDVIIPKETGILVDEFDIEAMAEAIIELLQNDTKVKQMGQAGSAYIHQHPQIAHYTNHLEKILKSAIS